MPGGKKSSLPFAEGQVYGGKSGYGGKEAGGKGCGGEFGRGASEAPPQRKHDGAAAQLRRLFPKDRNFPNWISKFCQLPK